MKNLAFLTIATAFLLLSEIPLNAQSNSQIKKESLLTSKKWVCLNVSKKKLSKIDFRFEVGNELSFSIDKKYAFKNNDYNYQNGTWKMDSKYLYFFYNASDGTNRIESSKYKVKSLTATKLRLKRLEKPKGNLEFK